MVTRAAVALSARHGLSRDGMLRNPGAPGLDVEEQRMRPSLFARSALALAVLGAISGCATGPATPSGAPGTPAGGSPPASGTVARWPRPADAAARAAAAGLQLEVKEHLAVHSHAHLDVFVDGQPVLVPAGIGINIDDPEVKRFEDPGGISYAGIEECDQPCISPLHTHAESGILHTESSATELHTLGQFFDEWGVALTESCVGELCSPTPIAVYLDGVEFAGHVRGIELADQREIAIVIGTPPEVIPVTADFTAP
jgi:hypothetical protein